MTDDQMQDHNDTQTGEPKAQTNLQRVRALKAADNERRTALFGDAAAIDQQREEAARPMPALMQRLHQLQSQVARLSGEAAEIRQALATAVLLAEAGLVTDTTVEQARLSVVEEQLEPVTADVNKLLARIDEVNVLVDDLGRRAADIRQTAQAQNPDLWQQERAALIEQMGKKRLAYIKILSEAANFNSQWPMAFYNGQVNGMRHNGMLDQIAQITPPHLRNLTPIPAPDTGFINNASASNLTNSHGTYDYEAECRALGIRLEDLE